MSIRSFLDAILASPWDRRCVAVKRTLPARPARYAPVEPPLAEPVARALAAHGIRALFTHQAAATELARRGKNIVVVTSTASGKSLCYNIPVLERLLADRQARAVYIFPTKALSHSQKQVVESLAGADSDLLSRVVCGVYDGDTPAHRRRRIRERSNILITNPDMLHQGILPHHTRWAPLFSNLQFVVLDEIHWYRGIFGSNVANVMRRLRRVCDHYGSRPQFICCSATIANPQELCEELTGEKMELVDDDGAPRGEKHFIIWNPPPVAADGFTRPSLASQAEKLITELVKSGVQTIAFARTRMGAEVISKNVRARLKSEDGSLSSRVKAYRGGYLAPQRRQIEAELAQRRLLAVVSTNALELGIDIGSLQGCVIIGYPGTIAGTWQQAGRAGRRQDESIVILVASADPVDQYLARHPEYLFDRTPENAVIDATNPHILAQHIFCAAFELPLRVVDKEYFGELFLPVVELLEECEKLTRIGERWYWSSEEYPSGVAGLRTISGEKLSIEAGSPGQPTEVIGEIDGKSVPFITYPNAVYIHEGQTYTVERIDEARRVVYVEKANVPYYTVPIVRYRITVKDAPKQQDLGGFRMGHCNASVTSQTIGFSKRRFQTGENLGAKEVNLEPVVLDTVATYIIIADEVCDRLKSEGLSVVSGLIGLKNLVAVVVPLLAMCDRQDIGVMLDTQNFNRAAIFIFDRFDGGLGFAQKVYEQIVEVLSMCRNVVSSCGCKDGCPSCVGTAAAELESMGPAGDEPFAPSKEATSRLVDIMLRAGGAGEGFVDD